MKRRDFVKASLAAGMAAAAAPVAGAAKLAPPEKHAFKLKYAPHFGMFANHVGDDPIKELNFIADLGFTALEDNGMRDKPVELQQRIAREMERLGLTMGVFVAHNIPWNDSKLAVGDKSAQEAFLKDIRSSIEVAKRVNARWMTVVPGKIDEKLAFDYQTANVIEILKRASAMLEPHNITMVLEPLNHYRDHPGLFLSTAPQSYMICKAVGSPSCKVLYDIYHMQISSGNLIPNIDLAWDEIGYFQIGDNPGRNEPGTGEINYRNVFKHIHDKGWTGLLGMEHGISRKGKEGEMALVQAYVDADGFAV